MGKTFLEYYDKSLRFDILRHQIFEAISVDDIKNNSTILDQIVLNKLIKGLKMLEVIAIQF